MTKVIKRITLWGGIVLVLGAVALLIATRVAIPNNQSNSKLIVSRLTELLPEKTDGYPDGKGDKVMPCIELDGVDFVGIIEIPLYDVTLPVCNEWVAADVEKYPHRYTGSLYDNSLVLGGSDNEGQFDFMKLISNGDPVYLTDMTGACYSFSVCDIEKTDDVSYANLINENCDLTFFARNTYGFDYTVVRCKLS